MKNSELYKELTNHIVELIRLEENMEDGPVKTLTKQGLSKLVHARADITPWDGELEDPLADMEDHDQADMFGNPEKSTTHKMVDDLVNQMSPEQKKRCYMGGSLDYSEFDQDPEETPDDQGGLWGLPS